MKCRKGPRPRCPEQARRGFVPCFFSDNEIGRRERITSEEYHSPRPRPRKQDRAEGDKGVGGNGLLGWSEEPTPGPSKEGRKIPGPHARLLFVSTRCRLHTLFPFGLRLRRRLRTTRGNHRPPFSHAAPETLRRRVADLVNRCRWHGQKEETEKNRNHGERQRHGEEGNDE